MEYILLGVVAFTNAVQNILKKKYNEKHSGGTFVFGTISVVAACLLFALLNRDWTYSASQIGYSLGFAASYCAAVVFSFLAIQSGPLAKTNLIFSCSLLMPTFYGILFLQEQIKATLIAGILFLVGAIFLTNYKKTDGHEEPVSLKWIIFVTLAFFGNGMCATVQKMETEAFGSSGKNVFMIVALALVTVFMLALTLCSKSEREGLSDNLKGGWHLALLCGVANGLTNFLIMILNSLLPASIVFPVISALGMTLVFIYSVAVIKEKYTPIQKIGFALGILSVILLNI